MNEILARDWREATLVGRIDFGDGPTPVVRRKGRLADVSRWAPTASALLSCWDARIEGTELGTLSEFAFARAWDANPTGVRLLAPIDLHCVKAAGVTFAVSTLERVIEERARGDARGVREITQGLRSCVGLDLESVKPWVCGCLPAQGRIDRGGAVVAIPGGRHRSRCADIHQSAAPCLRWMGRLRGHPVGFELEQP